MTEPYISRSQAEDFLKAFDAALKQPASHPVVFHVWGVGGVGKSTLLKKLQELHPADRVAIAKVSFGRTEGIDTPIAMMKKLHTELKPQFPPAPLLRREVTKLNPPPDAFSQLYDQYFDTLHQLKTESADGKGAASEEQINLARRIASVGASAIAAWASEGIVSPAIAGKAGEFAVDVASAGLSEKDRFQQLLQQHPATRKKRELQELMLEPVPKLTGAFVKSLIEWSSRRPIALLVDTYEKKLPDVDLWLWRSLLGNHENLRSHSIRLVVMGRHCLLEAEGWRKLQQDLKIVNERSLDRFDLPQTQNYLAGVGIIEPEQIQQIYQTTKGLPWYLNWIRERRLRREAIDFSQGNQEIDKFLLQGLNTTQKQVIRWVACCRWFNSKLIQYLLEQQQLDFYTAVDEQLNAFEWLTQKISFVEFAEGVYRLDDVARDVFRRSLWYEDSEQFHHIHGLMADYFLAQSDREVSSDFRPSAKYENHNWRKLRIQFLYYLLFSRCMDIQCKFVTHLLEEQYFNNHIFWEEDMIEALMQNIIAEAEIVSHPFLRQDICKFLIEVKPLVIEETELNWLAIEASFNTPVNYEQMVKTCDQRQAKTDAALEVCLLQIEKLEGVAKFVALLYKADLCHKSQQFAWLVKAKAQAEKLVTVFDLEFSISLLRYLSDVLNERQCYEESLDCIEQIIDLRSNDKLAWFSRGALLHKLGFSEEAVESYDEAIEIGLDLHIIWYFRGCVLEDLGLLEEDSEIVEEAIESYDRAIKHQPNYFGAWFSKSLALIKICQYQEALASIEKTLEIIRENARVFEFSFPTYQDALDANCLVWIYRGTALENLGKWEEAITSYDQAIAIKPNCADAYYGKARWYGLKGNIDATIANLDQAIKLDSEFEELASIDSEFDAIRGDDRFKALIEGSE